MKSDASQPFQPTEPPPGSDGVREFLAFVLALVSMVDWILVGLGVATPLVGLLLGVVPFSAACASLFGRRAGVVAALFTATVGWYVVLPPAFSFNVNEERLVWAFAFAVLGASVLSLCLSPRDRSLR